MAVAVAGFAAPAQAAAPPGGCNTTRLLPDGGDPGVFYQCDADLTPVTKHCPQGTTFDPLRMVCGWELEELIPTTVKAGTAKLSVLPLGVSNLNATVTTNGWGLYNALVTFTSASGKVLCTARTDIFGQASCDAGGLLSTVDQLLRGYTATYTGNAKDGLQALAGSTGKGTIVLL
ncbi:carbohydrate-binding module family 14 protein [Streptomyces sp. NPDC058622]|uniref:carbohydrate-binding module family 14 protein n=1 Tax=Streptomyces sp. NPDC058622 TaxID=3346562 RepID=UPI003660BD81